MPEIFVTIIVCLVASLFAGIGTGFVGMSAAAAITPIVMTFLGQGHFEVTAIALASDILASAIASLVYFRKKRVKIKESIPLLSSVLVFTLVGTIVGYYVPNNIMGIGTIISILLMGLKLLIFPTKVNSKRQENLSAKRKFIYSIVFGALIGFVCGFVGAGGGMMLLLVLTTVLGFKMHDAVGTSLFIMTFAALVGSIGHIIFQGISESTLSSINFDVLMLCVLFTFIFSLFSSKIANKMSEKQLNYISGAMLITIALIVGLIQIS